MNKTDCIPVEKYITPDTSLAAYLISIGFDLVRIQYDDTKRTNRPSGNFEFYQTSKLQLAVQNYYRTEAPGDIIKYEHAKKNLLDRIMRGLP